MTAIDGEIVDEGNQSIHNISTSNKNLKNQANQYKKP